MGRAVGRAGGCGCGARGCVNTSRVFFGRFHMPVIRALYGLAQLLTMANIFMCVRYLFFGTRGSIQASRQDCWLNFPILGLAGCLSQLAATLSCSSRVARSPLSISRRERHFLNCGPLSHFQIFHDFSEGLFGLHMGAGFSVCPIFASLVFANQESPLTTGKK